jgi:hypothetical protein
MRLMNHRTGENVGDLSDLSANGFRLESTRPIRVNQVIEFQVDMELGMSDKPFLVFTAVSRWCKQDAIDTRLYDVGFEIVQMDGSDRRAFSSIYEQYGRKAAAGGDTYLWGR